MCVLGLILTVTLQPGLSFGGAEASVAEDAKRIGREAFEKFADLAVKLPPVIRTADIAAYSTNRLDFALNNGLGMTAKGRLWASWIAGGDGPDSFTVASYSDDRGDTWSDVAFVIDGHGDVPTKGNICGRTNIIGTFWLDPEGRFHVYTDQTVFHHDGRAGIWDAVAIDPDATPSTWGPAVRIGNGHLMNKPAVLANGKCAVAGYLNETWKNSNFAAVEGAFRDLDAERGSTCYVSSDKGLTWEMRGTVPFPANDWNETSVVELGDGVLRMFARVCVDGCGKIMVADSKDEGRTWTKPYDLKSMNNPNARFQVQRLKSGRLLFVKHGAPTTGGTAWQGRDHLTAYVSDDDGATWKGGLELFAGASSYPDACQGPDGTIYVTHDHDRGGKAEIWFHRFTEEDVLARRIVSPEGRFCVLVSRAMASKANMGIKVAGGDKSCWHLW